MADAPGPSRARSVYRIRRAYYARALGRTAIIGGVLMLLTTAGLALDAPAALTAFLVVLTAVALVVVAVIAVSVVLPPMLLHLDDDGFRVSKRHTSGRGQAPWYEVQQVASQQGEAGWVLMIQHADGQHTAVPLELTDADPVAVERDVRDRLDQAHGYRPLA